MIERILLILGNDGGGMMCIFIFLLNSSLGSFCVLTKKRFNGLFLSLRWLQYERSDVNCY